MGQTCVRVELVRVRIGILGSAQSVDLVATDLEVLVRVPGMVSIGIGYRVSWTYSSTSASLALPSALGRSGNFAAFSAFFFST